MVILNWVAKAPHINIVINIIKDALYDSVAGTKSSRLKGGVKTVDKLSPEDEESAKRWDRHAMRTATRQIGVSGLWILFILTTVAFVILLLGFFVVAYEYANEIIEKKQSGLFR